MAVSVDWTSQAGTKTTDNRDCGGIGIRADEALCVVLDGSTNGAESGALALEIATALIDWYVSSKQEITAENLTACLRQLHETLCKKYPAGSASYAVVHIVNSNEATLWYAGDCLLGRCKKDGSIDWLHQPHTLANIDGKNPVSKFADVPARHLLTRSFRASEFMPPDSITAKIDGELLIGTDGFWAELSGADQVRFMNGQDIRMPAEGDDRSVLRIRLIDGGQDDPIGCDQATSGNLYVKKYS